MALIEGVLLQLRVALRTTFFGAAAGVMALLAVIMAVAALCVGIGMRFGPVIGLLAGGGVFLLFALFLMVLARPPRRRRSPPASAEERPAAGPSAAPAVGLEAMAAGLVGEEIARRPYGALAAAVAAGAMIGWARRPAKTRRTDPAAR